MNMLVSMLVGTLGLAFSLIAPAGAVEDSNAEAVFAKANENYRQGRFAQAAELYEQLTQADIGSFEVHYNLGNAALQAGDMGRSIAAYRTALKLAPRNTNIRANLAFARSKIRDVLAPEEPSRAAQVVFFWHYYLNIFELVMALLVFNAAFWLLWTARVLWRRTMSPTWLLVALAGIVVLVAGSVATRLTFPERLAVVQVDSSPAFAGMLKEGVVRFTLNAGAEIAVTDQEGDWLQIRLPDGTQGWMHHDSLRVLKL